MSSVDQHINTEAATQEGSQSGTAQAVSRTTMNIPEDVWKDIQRLAIDRDTTATAIVIEGLRRTLAEVKGATNA